MVAKCKLCRQSLDRSAREHCTCGWTLDGNCKERHEPWCPRGSGDRWIGVAEF